MIKGFKNKHKGKTIYVLGSGSSIDYFPNKTFLNDEIVIGVNYSYKHFKVQYNICHHHSMLNELAEHLKKMKGDTKFFVSQYDCGKIQLVKPKISETLLSKYVYIYEHNNQSYLNFNNDMFDYLDNDKLYCGGTTVINAISLAVYMGAKNIILIGCDNGLINGKSNYSGYYKEMGEAEIKSQYNHSVGTNDLVKKVRNFLSGFGISLLSLSPFLDLTLEGNKLN